MASNSNSGSNSGDFWGKGMADSTPAGDASSSAAPGGEDGFWDKAASKKKKAPGEKKPGRWKRVLLFSVLGVFVLLAILVALAPTIASSFAPGIIQSQAAAQIKGGVKVAETSLSWGGPQRITGIVLADENGKTIASLDSTISAGLFGLATGSRDLGEIRLQDVRADIVRRADGTTNVQEALSPKGKQPATPKNPAPKNPAPKSAPIKLPESLAAKVTIESLEATLTDYTAGATTPVVASITDFEATFAFDVGKPINIEASGKALQGTPKKPIGEVGRFALNAIIDDAVANDGLVEPKNAKVDIKLTAGGLPVALAQAFAPATGLAPLTDLLGPTLDVGLTAKGTMTKAAAELEIKSQGVLATAQVALADNTVRNTAPITLQVAPETLAALAPQYAGQQFAADDTARVSQFPRVNLTIDALSIPTPGPAGLDFRGAAADINLALTEVAGSVRLAAGQAPRPFTIAPLRARLLATDLAQGIQLTAASRATLDTQPAGDLNVDIRAGGLVTKGGDLNPAPTSLDGNVTIRNIATAIAQPFVQAFNLDLNQDIGPVVDIALTAAAKRADNASLDTSPTDITLTVRSQKLTADAGLTLSADAIKTREEGVTITLANAAGMASRMVPASSGWSIAAAPGANAGAAIIRVPSLNIPRNGAVMLLDKAAASASLRLSGMRLLPVGPGIPGNLNPLDVGELTAATDLKSGGDLALTLNSAMSHDGQPFALRAGFDIPAAIGPGGSVNAAALRPVGSFELTDVPLAIAQLVMPDAPVPQGAEPRLSVATLLRDVMGPRMALKLTSSKAAGDALALRADLTSQGVEAAFEGDLSRTLLSVKGASAKSTLAPTTVAGLLKQFAPTVQGLPRLVGPATVNFALQPIDIPLKDGTTPLLDQAGLARVALTIPGRTLVEGLVINDEAGNPRSLGTLGVENLEIRAQATLAALVGTALPEQRPAKVTLAARALAGPEQSLLRLSGEANAEISEGKPAGNSTLTLRVDEVNTTAMDRLAGKPGFVSGLLGETAAFSLNGSLVANTGAFDFNQSQVDLEAAVVAPRVRTSAPLKLALRPDRFTLAAPADIQVTLDPAFVNALMAPAPAPAPGAFAGFNAAPPKAAARFTESTTIQIELARLNIPRPGMKGTLDAALRMVVPSIAMVTSDNQAVRLGQLALTVNSRDTAVKRDATPGAAAAPGDTPIDLLLTIARAQVADRPAAEAMQVAGTISGLVTPDGTFSPATALVNLNGNLPVLPTALLDAFSPNPGLLPAALGPVVALNIRADNVPLDLKPRPNGPQSLVEARATSERATANLRGNLGDQVFIASEPVQVSLTEITKDLADKVLAGLPAIGSLTKSKDQAPAMLVATGLTAPLGNDLTKLNGEVRIDPGEARFGTSTQLGKLLKQVNARDEGTIGRRLEPLSISVKSGVATYQRWSVPLGEFSVQTEGTVDLVKREMDVVTYVPFLALSDQAAGSLNTGIGSLLGRLAPPVIDSLTMVPIRTRGSLDNPSTGIDFEMAAQNLRKSLSPDQLLKDGLGGLLRQALPQSPAPK